jgi:hypothetical protein
MKPLFMLLSKKIPTGKITGDCFVWLRVSSRSVNAVNVKNQFSNSNQFLDNKKLTDEDIFTIKTSKNFYDPNELIKFFSSFFDCFKFVKSVRKLID